MLPDLIVIGDSHSNALVEGCLAHGLRVEMLRFSGNFWHEGRVTLDDAKGLRVDHPASQQQIEDLCDRLGGRPVLGPDVPVLATMAYHLGRLVPPFGFYGHVTEARFFDADPEAQYVSRACAEAYIGSFRGTHVRLARRMAKLARMVMVAPPLCMDEPNYRTFHDSITRRLRTVGLTVHDPNSHICPGGTLPPDLLAEDQRHGNAEYGRRVVAALLDQGLITRRAEAA